MDVFGGWKGSFVVLVVSCRWKEFSHHRVENEVLKRSHYEGLNETGCDNEDVSRGLDDDDREFMRGY